MLSSILHSQHGAEVEALEPWHNPAEARVQQPGPVNIHCFWDEGVFQRRAFLTDLEIAVAVCFFEGVVHHNHVLMLAWIRESDFLG